MQCMQLMQDGHGYVIAHAPLPLGADSSVTPSTRCTTASGCAHTRPLCTHRRLACSSHSPTLHTYIGGWRAAPGRRTQPVCHSLLRPCGMHVLHLDKLEHLLPQTRISSHQPPGSHARVFRSLRATATRSDTAVQKRERRACVGHLHRRHNDAVRVHRNTGHGLSGE